jgi:hypothetical protein
MDVSTLVLTAAAVVSAVAAVVAAYFVNRSLRQQARNFESQSAAYKLSLSADTALKFDTAFNATTFKTTRSRAAKALLTHINEAEAEDAADIFDFFDTVGLFVRLGAMTDEVAHSLFFNWINLYWRAGKQYIGSEQAETSTVWEDFKSVYDRVCVIERQRDENSADLTMAESRLRKLLQDEVDLLGE